MYINLTCMSNHKKILWKFQYITEYFKSFFTINQYSFTTCILKRCSKIVYNEKIYNNLYICLLFIEIYTVQLINIKLF